MPSHARREIEIGDWFLKAGTIDDISWFQPTVEIWTSSAQPWAPHFEDVMRYERIPQ